MGPGGSEAATLGARVVGMWPPWGPCTLSSLTALGPWLQLAESAALQILEQMG